MATLLWTSGDVCLMFRSQDEVHMIVSSDSPMVPHLQANLLNFSSINFLFDEFTQFELFKMQVFSDLEIIDISTTDFLESMNFVQRTTKCNVIGQQEV